MTGSLDTELLVSRTFPCETVVEVYVWYVTEDVNEHGYGLVDVGIRQVDS